MFWGGMLISFVCGFNWDWFLVFVADEFGVCFVDFADGVVSGVYIAGQVG